MMRDLKEAQRRNWFVTLALLAMALHAAMALVGAVSGRWDDVVRDLGFTSWIGLYVLTEMTVSRKERALAWYRYLHGVGRRP